MIYRIDVSSVASEEADLAALQIARISGERQSRIWYEGLFVAIGENSLNASDILLERLPEAQIWFVRVGHRQFIGWDMRGRWGCHDFRGGEWRSRISHE
jgi:hypothetical protein